MESNLKRSCLYREEDPPGYFSNKAEPASLLEQLLTIFPLVACYCTILDSIPDFLPFSTQYLSDRPLFSGQRFFNRDFFNATNRYRLSRQFHGRGYALDQFLLAPLPRRSSSSLSPTGDKIFFFYKLFEKSSFIVDREIGKRFERTTMEMIFFLLSDEPASFSYVYRSFSFFLSFYYILPRYNNRSDSN